MDGVLCISTMGTDENKGTCMRGREQPNSIQVKAQEPISQNQILRTNVAPVLLAATQSRPQLSSPLYHHGTKVPLAPFSHHRIISFADSVSICLCHDACIVPIHTLFIHPSGHYSPIILVCYPAIRPNPHHWNQPCPPPRGPSPTQAPAIWRSSAPE